ncbi:NUDIX hydrolase [Hydrogenophaga defluvii]|uniref:NUDIX domain-containing protein n=1 Tax=Hydrogenophaga defluvii TaxID=249410 RepID=A0ABW2S7G0_9BURK
MIYQRPPLRPRQALAFEGQPIGSVEVAVAQHFQAHGLLATDGAGWRVAAPFDALAHALREASLLGAWRNELLPVLADSGQRVGHIERAAVRALGLATAAVHLTAQAPDGNTWVQQRAFNKPNDPGLWDTLMGGMVSAADTLAQALERETWEEAGLRLDQLHGLTHAGHLIIQRPSGGADDVGYTVERIDWFSATLPEGVVPENQDGEVERFDCVDLGQLRADIVAGRYTLEAALILAPDLIDGLTAP